MATDTNIGPCNCCTPIGWCEACEGHLPTTIYVTFSDGVCDCFPSSTPIPLFKTSATNWDSCTSFAACDDCPGYPGVPALLRGSVIRLTCLDDIFTPNGNAVLIMSWNDGTNDYALTAKGTVISCDPVLINFGSFGGTGIAGPTMLATVSGGPCNTGSPSGPTAAIVTE